MSRIVKEIYDAVQAAYDGRLDEQSGAWVDYRTTFFTPEEVWAMAARSLGLEDGG
jgi:hypothetical protein